MSTATFNCPHCGKIMGVSGDDLGKPVRCPHCQKVVQTPGHPHGPDGIAPFPMPPARPQLLPAAGLEEGAASSEGSAFSSPLEPGFQALPTSQAESIFEPTEDGGGDALFSSSAKSLVEMPPEPAPPPAPTEPFGEPLHYTVDPPLTPTFIDVPMEIPALHQPILEVTAPSPHHVPDHESTMAASPQEPAAPSGTGLNLEVAGFPSGGPASNGHPPNEMLGLAGDPEKSKDGDNLAGLAKPRAIKLTRRGAFIPTLLIILIPYSIIATVAVIWLYNKKQEPSLEILPDPKPDPKNGGPAKTKSQQRVRIDLKVPEKLRGSLGQTIQVGDLEVIPKKIERIPDDALRLTLALKNISTDTEFNPVSDRFLDRSADRMPYTFLQIGPIGRNERIYGGSWQTLRKDEAFEGRLQPGGEMEAQLTTSLREGDVKKVKNLVNFTGPLLWRIQVRRGFVQHRGRDNSTTAVIGVEFGFEQIERNNDDS